ncbi:MAG: hypothetical protein QOJ65_432 [Fimbriimonadaceae bacterium]|nr:hypothetical protein [Fimbriimonadaceae bacterium]
MDAFEPHFTQASAPGSPSEVMGRYAQQFGVPIYPGASPDTSHFAAPPQETSRIYLVYVSSDPIEKVLEFYKRSMTMQVFQYGTATQLKGTSSTGADVTINVGPSVQRSGTNFTITAVALPATRIASASPAMPPPTVAPRTYQTPPATATRDDNGQTWDYSTNRMPAENPTPVPAPAPTQTAPPPPPVEDPPADVPPEQTSNGETDTNQGTTGDNPPGGEPPQ